MKQLDAGSTAYRAMIEKELAARAGKPVAVATPGLCAACGTKNDGDAKFCKSCGAKLKAA
jgi:rRNA maturation endonuclease Nob1